MLIPLLVLALAATPLVQAERDFTEARRLADRDAGKLWGRSLAGPILWVDMASQLLIADRADPAGVLKPAGAVFVAPIPPDMMLANTAVDWGGLRWTMVIGPLPEDAGSRARLLMHESFHRIQDQLGIPTSAATNSHLEHTNARIDLRLEWRALRAALSASGSAREQAVRDALAFRARRLAAYPLAAPQERSLERGEGLAEYTGYRLSGLTRAESLARIDTRIASAITSPSVSRSFAYVSGPLYGLLLDDFRPGWRGDVKADRPLAELLPPQLRVGLAPARPAAYDGAALAASEETRTQSIQARQQRFMDRLVSGPVLVLPIPQGGSSSFDPNGVVQMDVGTVYIKYRFKAEWGILDVADGVLATTRDGLRRLQVVAPPAAEPRGPGWSLTLEPGWRLVAGARPGDWLVVRDGLP